MDPSDGGDHDFELLYRDARAGLWRAVFAFTGGRGDLATDAVDEAFARALEHGPSIRSPLPWLYRTAFRVAVDEIRRERRTSAEAPGVGTGSDEALPEELMEALRALSPNQRAATFLFYVADLPVKDVAERLGMSPATVKVHLHRGRKKLRELLGSEHVEGAPRA